MKAIVIDSGSMKCILKSKPEQASFLLVQEALFDHKLTLMMGGTKFFEELGRTAECLRIVNLYKDEGKIHVSRYENDIVDRCEKNVKKIKALNCLPNSFNDEHIVALLITSRAKIACTEDNSSHPYLKHDCFFTTNKPKIISKTTPKRATKLLLA